MATLSPSTACPCGSSRPLDACCGPYLAGQSTAPTAAALMRSRYTAFCLGNIDYLIATHHPTRRDPTSRRTLTATANQVTWLGLTVLNTDGGQPEDKAGMVEFVAVYRENGRADGQGKGKTAQLHERSRFRQQRGRWFYLDGDTLPPLQPKRNAPCWCGSGKKFKQCHGK